MGEFGKKHSRGQKRTNPVKASNVGPKSKKQKKEHDGNSGNEVVESEFTYLRFKFLLRSPETVGKAMKLFLDICHAAEDESDEGGEGLNLLAAYLKSSPECTDVLNLLSRLKTLPLEEIGMLCEWARYALRKSHQASSHFEKVQDHIVSAFVKKLHLLVILMFKDKRSASMKALLMLLITITTLGSKYIRMLHYQLDFTDSKWLQLWISALQQRNRKDEADVRACTSAVFTKLLQADEDDITKSLVEQKVLLQEILHGLKYDQADYVIANLKTIHTYIVQNSSIAKTAKLRLFNTAVFKDLVSLYHWLGPDAWKPKGSKENRQAQPEKMEYSSEHRKVAETLHPLLVDLLTNHKIGIFFREKFLVTSSSGIEQQGGSHKSKVSNESVTRVLQMLVTSYSTPLAHRLVLVILRACPDKVHVFLKLLHTHLVPRPVDTWIACVQFFLEIVENHEWPDVVEKESDGEMLPDERVSQILQFLFPPEKIIDSLKEGLKSDCGVVQHLCLQALNRLTVRGQHYHSASRQGLGEQAPITLAIEGFVSKILPNAQILQNLLKKLAAGGHDQSSGGSKSPKTKAKAEDPFVVPVTREMYKGTDILLPQATKSQYLVELLQAYCLHPEHLTEGSSDTLPTLLKLVASYTKEDASESTQSSPSLCLLQTLSKCDVKHLSLFGKGGNKADLKQSLIYYLLRLMQDQTGNKKQTAQTFIITLLTGSGLFEGQDEELASWLHHLEGSETAPEDVVLYFVSLLHQYMPNPYPAIDRLIEKAEEDSPSLDGGPAWYGRLEYSPLVLFALSGDFHSSSNVHKYVCNVIIDILHSLHDPCSFSRLVHSFSEKLDPAVTKYVTFHASSEECSAENIRKRMRKTLRVRNVGTVGHAGVRMVLNLIKDKAEARDLVDQLLPGDCLPLVFLALRYLDELVQASEKVEKENYRKIADKCLELLRAASNHLVSSSQPTAAVQDGHERSKKISMVSTAEDSAIIAGGDCGSRQEELKTGAKTQQPGKIKVYSDLSSSESQDSDEEDMEDDKADDGDSIENEQAARVGKGETESARMIMAPDRYCAPLPRSLGFEGQTQMNMLQQRRDWAQEVLNILLGHPLVQGWLFGDSFLQVGAVRKLVFRSLCNLIKELGALRSSSSNNGASNPDPACVFVPERCAGMVGHVLQFLSQESVADSGSSLAKVKSLRKKSVQGSLMPAEVQSSLCMCLDSLFSVAGEPDKLKGLLELVKLPPEHFVNESSNLTDLGKFFVTLAKTLPENTVAAEFKQLDSNLFSSSGLVSPSGLASSMKSLFHSAAVLKNLHIEDLANKIVKSCPKLALECSPETFSQLFARAVSDATPGVVTLVKNLMASNAECMTFCCENLRKWQQQKSSATEYASIMLTYIELILKNEDVSTADEGIQAIAESVCNYLEKEEMNYTSVNSAFFLVVCHLVNFSLIGRPLMQTVATRLLSLLASESVGRLGIAEAHLQLLAAILRQESIQACSQEGSDESGQAAQRRDSLANKWAKFEELSGKVLLCLLRLLAADTKIANASQRRDGILVSLCQELLELALPDKVKASIVSLWPALVSKVFNEHYSEAAYISLLRQLLEKVFTEVEQGDRSDNAKDEPNPPDSKRENSEKIVDEEEAIPVAVTDFDEQETSSTSEEDDDVPDLNAGPGVSKSGAAKLDSSTLPKQTATKSSLKRRNMHQRKPLREVVWLTVKRWECNVISEVARKCVALFGEEDSAPFKTEREEIVCIWTDPHRLRTKRFFFWPRKAPGLMRRSDLILSSDEHGKTLKETCVKCIKHPLFLAVLRGGEQEDVKAELVCLLASLVRLEVGCVDILPLKLLVAAYGATLSLTDQNLLYLMCACDHYAEEKMQFGQWGKASIRQAEMKNLMGKSLQHQTTFQEVMEQFRPAVMLDSIHNFPLMRSMQFDQRECVIRPDRLMSQEGVYDPRFLLPIFLHFLGPEYVVDVRTFIQNNCLGYTLAALSSHDCLTRKVAYSILNAFKAQVEAVPRWRSRPLLLQMLGAVEKGMTEDYQKLPSIITLFLARAAQLFLKPEHEMYLPILNFLILKPSLDLNNVPEFYRLFNSPSLKERLWLLRLLHEGLRETSDHRLLQKRHVYKLLNCYTNSSLCDSPTRLESLKVLVKATSISSIVKDLVVKHGLLLWLVSFIRNDFCGTAEARDLVCQILHNLCFTTEFQRQQLWWSSLPRMSRHCWLQTPLLLSTRLLLDKCSNGVLDSKLKLKEILRHSYFKTSHSAVETLPAD